MNIKGLLRFYFRAERLNSAVDNIIMRKACLSYRAYGGGEAVAEELCGLISDKAALCRLYGYLDGVMSRLDSAVRGELARYCGTRRGEGDPDRLPAMRRAVAAFTRRARRLGDFAEEAAVAFRYIHLAGAWTIPP